MATQTEFLPPKAVIISGPSGSGKSTVGAQIIKDFDGRLEQVITSTSRAPRPGEQDGVDYHFKIGSDFRDMIRTGALIEYIQFLNHHGSYYGVEVESFEKPWKNGKIPLALITWEGMVKVRRAYPDRVLSIWMDAENTTELERRLRLRKMSDEAIKMRLAEAERERDHVHLFDYQVINRRDGVAATVEEVTALIKMFLSE